MKREFRTEKLKKGSRSEKREKKKFPKTPPVIPPLSLLLLHFFFFLNFTVISILLLPHQHHLINNSTKTPPLHQRTRRSSLAISTSAVTCTQPRLRRTSSAYNCRRHLHPDLCDLPLSSAGSASFATTHFSYHSHRSFSTTNFILWLPPSSSTTQFQISSTCPGDMTWVNGSKVGSNLPATNPDHGPI